MAKKLTKDEAYAEFLKDLVNEFPEDRRESVAESLAGSAKAKDAFLRQSEFSRFMDEAKQTKAQAEAEIATAREVATKWETWGQESYKELSAATTRAQQYEALYGPIDPNAPAKAVPGFTKEEVQAMLSKELETRSQQMVAFSDTLVDLKMRHRDGFKETLNTQELLAYAAEHGINDLSRAYDSFVQPRIEERRDADFKDQLKRAREEGAREALSNAKLPVGFSRHGNPVLDAINERVTAEPGQKRDHISDAVADLTARLSARNAPTVG